MRGSFFVSLGFVLFSLESILAVQDGPSEEDDDSGLTAKELLKTIAPTYHLAKVPPGFPPLDRMNTDNFNYGTRGRYIKVVAALNETVKMVKNYIEISKVQMNFTYDKQQPENGTWRFNGTGVLNIGKQRVHVSIAEDGVIEGDLDEISFEDILAEYNHRELTTSLQFDSKAIQIKKVKVRGRVFTKDGYFYLTFQGYADLEDVSPSYATITVSKAPDDQLNVYAILEFKNLKPSTVLDQIVDDETMDIQFFSKMLEESDLIASNKTQFGITVSLTDVYNITYDTTTGRIIRDVLQSHIPSGITLLCPIDSLGSKKVPPVKLAFVMKRPNFDFLVDKHDKISLKRILKALSSEFAPPSLPVFLRRTKKAFTSHISFNSETNLFAIFVRMKDEVGLAPGVINSKVRSIVLVRNVSGTSGDDDWRLSVRGSLLIGQTKMRMRYAQMGYKPEKVYGMTAVAKKLTIQDVIEEFKPKIFATKEIKAMIENTEISDIEMENVNLFSRITRTNTPHLLLTGRANLPEWEDNTRVSMLLLLDKKQWYMKIALTLVHSPLSNILQAFTGFELTRTSLLHNNNIITSIVSSPLPSYSLLPPKIITTPLLRVPVATGLTVLALFKFPDNCGDDQLCEAAKQVLDTKTAYTFRGVLSLEGFVLEAPVADVIEFGNGVAAVNSTLVFNVGKETTLDLRTSLKIRDTDYIFDGRLSFLKSGKIRLNMSCRKKTWAAPFGITIAQFKNLTMNMTMNPKDTLNYIKLKGIIRIGAIGNRGEMETDVNLNFNPSLPDAGQFYANFTNVTIADLMRSFTIDYELPYVLRAAKFPNGLMLSYSSLDETNGHLTLHGDIKILGRVLPCEVQIIQPGSIKIITSNSPAPVILGNGQIIIEEESGNELRGPSILASINHKEANVTMNGFAKVLGLESKLNVSVQEDGLSFKISGKLMNFKDTELKAESQGSLDDFKVSGCFNDIPEQVQLLLTEIISKAGNQSTLNIERAEKNLVLADQYYEAANQHELQAMQELEDLRKIYEIELMDYGRFEVRVNDTCKPIQCDVTCFGCPEWSSCCHRDVFGECIKCASWKKCCWKDVDPICIAEDDGCRVVRSIAESDLSQRQVQIEEEKMHLEKMGILAVEAEENKGKHKAVLEAATDAKRLVVEDSGPGLNAADAIRNLGPLEEWLSVDSVCYNTSLEEAATGCMYFHVKGSFYKGPKSIVSIGSCLKEELVNELAESLANYMFPGIVDTSSDDVTDVKPDAESPSESPTESPPVAEDYNGEQKSQQTSKGSRDKLEQDALYQRKRRDIMNIDTEIQPKLKRRLSKTHKNLLENPFWDFKIDNQDVKSRSKIPPHPVKKQIMSGMLHKRWRIPENAAGRCHIFHQLIDICKDMADTIVLMDKSLSSTVKKYKKEKAVVTDKAASSIDFLGEAAKLVDLNETSMSSVDQTLQVVNEGIDIWASKCEKELNWQNSVGVQNWLASMDLRIQELGGFGAFRFLENLFHAFEALFEAATYSDDNADLALMLLQRIRKISTGFNRIFQEKLSIRTSQSFAKEILHHLSELKHERLFCT